MLGHVMRRDEEYGGNSDGDGCGREEKERKTEAEVDGQCKCGLEGEGTISGEETQKPICAEATCHIHRPHIEVGKDAVEEKENCNPVRGSAKKQKFQKSEITMEVGG